MRRKFITLFIATFAVMLGMGIISPLIPLYAEGMGATGIWLGVIFSVFSLSNLIFTPMMGKISDKRGRKKFICMGLFLYSVLSFGYVFAESVYSLTWVRFLHGAASAMVLPLVMAYVGDIAPRGKEGKFMGYFNVSLYLGMGFGPFIGGVLTDAFGMASVFYAMTALSAVALAVTYLFLTEETAAMIKKGERDNKEHASFRGLFRNNIVRGLFSFRFITALGRGSIMVFLPVYAYSLGMSPTQIGTILTANMILVSLLQIPFGRLADKRSKIKLMMAGSAITGAGMLLVPSSAGFASLLAVSLFMGAGEAIGMPAATAVNAVLGRRYGMGTTMSVFVAAMSLGMVISPLAGGAIMDYISMASVFYFGAFAIFAGMVVLYAFTRGYDEHGEKKLKRGGLGTSR